MQRLVTTTTQVDLVNLHKSITEQMELFAGMNIFHHFIRKSKAQKSRFINNFTLCIYILISNFRAVLKKYLLEKSRIVQQGINERNYHVFYSMLAGATPQERESFHLLTPQEYFYLNQVHLL